MKEAIERRVQREGLGNVETILGDEKNPGLPQNSVEAVLIVDVFHEMADPVVLLRNVARALKQQGRIGIIDYREGEGGPGPDPDHVPPSAVIAQANAAGLTLVEQHKFLPYQYLLIFAKSRVVLTIAGSDSVAGAGIQADVKTFAAMGVYGVTAVTAITAQNTTGVIEVLPCTPEIVRSQIEAVARDVSIAAVKTGMLATSEIVNAAADQSGVWARSRWWSIRSCGWGTRTDLLTADAVSLLKTRLLRLAAVVTPNATEAAALSGIAVTLWRAPGKRPNASIGSVPRQSWRRGGISLGPTPSMCSFMTEGSWIFRRRARCRRGTRHGLRVCLGHCRTPCVGRRYAAAVSAPSATSRAIPFLRDRRRGAHPYPFLGIVL